MTLGWYLPSWYQNRNKIEQTTSHELQTTLWVEMHIPGGNWLYLMIRVRVHAIWIRVIKTSLMTDHIHKQELVGWMRLLHNISDQVSWQLGQRGGGGWVSGTWTGKSPLDGQVRRHLKSEESALGLINSKKGELIYYKSDQRDWCHCNR